jgi:hypothetical protein
VTVLEPPVSGESRDEMSVSPRELPSEQARHGAVRRRTR